MKHWFLYFSFLFFALLTSCGEEGKEVSEVDVLQIQSVGTLSTTEYTFGKVLKLEDDVPWYKWGDRKILISVKAKVKAGIDLSKLQKEDFQVSGKTITITLPEADIVSFEMNPDEIKTVAEDVNGFRASFNQDEKLKILALGETKLKKEVLESSIIKDARNNATVFLSNFYRDLGYERVIVKYNRGEDVIQKKL